MKSCKYYFQNGQTVQTEEAVRRVRIIEKMLSYDVRTAIWSHTVMEASNRIIPPGLIGFETQFNHTYQGIHSALAIKLTMDISRIFDTSNKNKHPREKQDKASVQVLGALIIRKDVQTELLREDNNRKIAIDEFVNTSQKTDVPGSEEQMALKRVRDIRTSRLAHSLFDEVPDQEPFYKDLNLLLGIAIQAANYAAMAIRGENGDFDLDVEYDYENAEKYFIATLGGLQAAINQA